MKKFDKSMVGKKVRFISEEDHESGYFCYPSMGTIGKVELFDNKDNTIFVQWPKGSTSGDDKWWVLEPNEVELVEEPVKHLSDEEVFDMLMPKLEKNGIAPGAYLVLNPETQGCGNEALYSPKDFEKAIALIYRIGYGRGQKGRPFEYQNTKNIQKEEDKLAGKKVVLVNPDEMDVAHGFHKGMIGTINGSFPNSDFIYVTFNYHTDALHKSKLMLIVDDKPKENDKVVFLDEKDSKEDPKFFPPVGTILECCDEGWYYTNKPWGMMSDHWKEVMNRNHDNWNKGLFYGNSKAKKVVPLC